MRDLLARVLVLALLASGAARAEDATTRQLLEDAGRFFARGDLADAAGRLDRAIARRPRDVPAEAYARRAAIFLARGEIAAGLDWIAATALPVYPTSDDVLAAQATLLARLPERRAEATALAEEIVARDARRYPAQLVIAEAAADAGAAGAARAVRAYRAYLAARSADLAAADRRHQLRLAFALLHAGDPGGAESVLRAVLAGGADDELAANARKGLCAVHAARQAWNQAQTLCARVLADGVALRGNPSVAYNLALATLARGDEVRALDLANEYVLARPAEARGYILRGEIYLRRARWAEAEAQLHEAERRVADEPTRALISRALGRVFLEEGRGDEAVVLLAAAAAARPDDLESLVLLAQANLAAGHGAAAAATARQALDLPGQGNNVSLLVLAGRGLYQGGDITGARGMFEGARAVLTSLTNANDPDIDNLLALTINRQAQAFVKAGDLVTAESLLGQAEAIAPASPVVLANLALVRLEKGLYPEALATLEKARQAAPEEPRIDRLLARAYLGLGETARAEEIYRRLEERAAAQKNARLLAELAVETASLTVDAGRLDEAVARLDAAVRPARGQPFEKAARRNAQLAHLHRGLQRIHDHQGALAVADFELALRRHDLLNQDEAEVATVGMALAALEAGEVGKASMLLGGVLERGGQVPWLRPAYAAIGLDLLRAYQDLTDGGPAGRVQAAALLEKRLAGAGAAEANVKALLRAALEGTALDLHARGADREAEAALGRALGVAAGEARGIENNRAALGLERDAAGARAVFERLGDRPPEALVNLGILEERAGNPRRAYELYTAARAAGARAARLDDWIEAKRRVFGF